MKKAIFLCCTIFLFFVMISLFIVPKDAEAISAWTRKEGVSCDICHVRINRPNQTGLDYMRQGFTFNVGQEKQPEAKLEEFGKYFSIFGILDMYQKRKDKDYNAQVAKISLYGGGSLGSNFSFFGETTLQPTDAQEIADLYMQYTLGSNDRYGFIRAGQFLPMLFSGDNTWEFANDNSAAFARDRRVGVAAGYNFGKAWGEIAAVKPAGDSSGGKVDFVANAQYIFTSAGTSFGAYYWDGKFNKNASSAHFELNPDTGTIDPIAATPAAGDNYTRYGVAVQFNEIKNLLISAAYSEGKGDSSAGGDKKTRGLSGIVEYLISDKASIYFNVVNDNPDTSVNDKTTTYKTAVYYWLSKYASVDAQYSYKELPVGNDNSVRLRLRFMF